MHKLILQLTFDFLKEQFLKIHKKLRIGKYGSIILSLNWVCRTLSCYFVNVHVLYATPIITLWLFPRNQFTCMIRQKQTVIIWKHINYNNLLKHKKSKYDRAYQLLSPCLNEIFFKKSYLCGFSFKILCKVETPTCLEFLTFGFMYPRIQFGEVSYPFDTAYFRPDSIVFFYYSYCSRNRPQLINS